MTKLQSHRIVKYLEEREGARQGEPVRFNDYVFPEDFTAEAVAKKFGTSLSSALTKLNRMVDEGILVSKRADVEGKPGKRLVFLVRTDADSAHAAVPMGASGARELLYLRNSKTVELSAKGDARVSSEFVLRNVSNRPLSEIPLPKFRYDLYGNESVYDHLESVQVNGREVPQSSDALIYFKGKKPGKCGLGGGYYDKNDDRRHYVEIVYVIPLQSPLQPGETVEIRVESTFPRAYSDMFKFEYLSVKIREITMRAELRVVAPKGHMLLPLRRYEDTIYRHGVFVMDASTDIRKDDVEAEMRPLRSTNSSISWEIERPVIGYLYGFPFAVKRKPSPRRSKSS